MTATARDWALRQIAIDAARFVRFPKLAVNKRARMSTSPFAFLRGTAPLFYELLVERPELGAGPEGDGFIVGDLHVENFGAFRPDVPMLDENRVEERAVFDVNDFDDATVAPQRLDVVRLVTSLLLTLRDLGVDGTQRLGLARALLSAHDDALVGDERSPLEPACVGRLLAVVRQRTRRQLLDKRTEEVRGARRFQRGPRYADLSPEIRDQVPDAFSAYVAELPEVERPRSTALEVIDSAFRVAGTGSLGALRVAVLTVGKGGRDGCFVFDIKEQGGPSSAVLVRPPPDAPADRVRRAMTTCLGQRPRMVGVTHLDGLSCLVRRLAPQEDRLDWRRVDASELSSVVIWLGTLVGRLHRRGAATATAKAWGEGARETLLHNAVELAAWHEAVYLAYLSESLAGSPAA